MSEVSPDGPATRLAPGLTAGILHLAQRLALPAPIDRARTTAAGAEDEDKPGYGLNPALPRKVFDFLTGLGRAAAIRFNERR